MDIMLSAKAEAAAEVPLLGEAYRRRAAVSV